MQTDRANPARILMLVSTLFGSCLLAACHSGFGASSSGSKPAEEPVTSRMSGIGGGMGAVSQLDFFEALESRSDVTWDELLAGVLLAAGRRADGDYDDRLNVARRAGILGVDVPPDGEALASPADLAKVLLRSQGIQLRESLSGEEAISLAARRSLMPADIGPRDPLSGAITVRALSAAGQPTATLRQGSAKPTSAPSKPPTSGSNP